MNLASAISETKDKTPDVIGRIKEMQAKDRLREIQAPFRGRQARRGTVRGSLMPAIARQRRGKPTPSHRPRKLLGAGLLAGAVSYFLNPAEGGRRRGMAIDKIKSVVRRGDDHAAKPSESAGNPFEGAQPKATPASVPVSPVALNDQDRTKTQSSQ